jgi:hypothetical protein
LGLSAKRRDLTIKLEALSSTEQFLKAALRAAFKKFLGF